MLLDDLVPVEDSKVWHWQQQAYRQQLVPDRADASAPREASLSCALADCYAAIVAAMLDDLGPSTPNELPLIIELGATDGQFAWQFMQRLTGHHLRPHNESPRFSYLMADSTGSRLEAWQQQPRLRTLRDRGLLQFGQVSVGPEPCIRIAGQTLTPTDLRQRPVVLISNHVLDALPTDLYRIRDGRLCRVLMALESEEDVLLTKPLASFAALTPRFEAREVERAATGVPLLDELIGRYRDAGRDIAIPVPKRGFEFLQAFVDRQAPLLLLAGEKAYTDPAQFVNKPPLLFQARFSQYTNLHLVAELFRHAQGQVQFQRHSNPDFATAAFWLPGQSSGVEFTRLPLMARVQLEEFSPLDGNELNDLLVESVGAASFEQLFAWLRQSRLDPATAETCLPFFLEDFHRSDEGLDRKLLRDLYLEAYELFFPVDQTVGFDYGIAQLLLALRFDGDALALMQSSLTEFGRTPERLYVYALVLLRLERRDEARAVLDECLSLRSKFAEARQVFDDHFGDIQTKKGTDLPHLTVSARDADAGVRARAVFEQQGAVWIQDLFPRAYIDEVRRAFLERFEDYKSGDMGEPNSVGNKRYTVPLRMQSPFSDPALFASPMLLEMLKAHMGDEPIVNAYGGVITYPGANSQHVHREHPLLFTNDQFNADLPAYAVNVLIPLVDLDEQLGGTQVWEGTHRLGGEERWQGPSKVVHARQGDALVLDYRTYHGGMPCVAGDMRPVLFITYSLPWFRDTLAFDNHDAVAISPSELAAIPPSHQPFFRFARKLQDKQPARRAAPELVA